MGKKKAFTAILVCVFLALSMIVAVTYAQSTIPTPSVPEFSLRFIRLYYSVTTEDPTTGINQTQQFENNTIEVSIRNQPYPDSINGINYHLFYNVRIKLNSEDNWSELYPPVSNYDNSSNFNSTAPFVRLNSPNASSSAFTVVTIYDYYPSYPPNTVIGFLPPFHFPPGTQVDLEVEAIIGRDSQAYIADHPTVPWFGGHYEPAIAVDKTSGWSTKQIIAIPEASTPSPIPTQLSSPSSSPLPTPSPTPTASPIITPTESPTRQPTIELIQTPNNTQENVTPKLIITALVIAIVVGLLVYVKKTKGKL